MPPTLGCAWLCSNGVYVQARGADFAVAKGDEKGNKVIALVCKLRDIHLAVFGLLRDTRSETNSRFLPAICQSSLRTAPLYRRSGPSIQGVTWVTVFVEHASGATYLSSLFETSMQRTKSEHTRSTPRLLKRRWPKQRAKKVHEAHFSAIALVYSIQPTHLVPVHMAQNVRKFVLPYVGHCRSRQPAFSGPQP